MSIKKVITLLAGYTCVFALLACSAPSSYQLNNKLADFSILGGTAVSEADIVAKSTVAILVVSMDQSRKETQFICTGSLLRPGVVLTAGHCVPPADPGIYTRMYVLFTSDLNTLADSDLRVVTGHVVHPQFGQSGPLGADSNDLALLKFEGSFPKGYRAARLLPNDSLLKPKLLVTLVGYGVSDAVQKTTDNLLRKVEMPWGQEFGQTEVILDQTDGNGACYGDSGGPAFVNIKGSMFLWGVISRGLGDDSCRGRGVYTKINAQMTFIEAALAQLSAN